MSGHKAVTINIANSASPGTPTVRKSLKTLQNSATSIDKENLVGRPLRTIKDLLAAKNTNENEVKRKKLTSRKTQASLENKVTEEDLTSEGEPSEEYWKILAEKRRVALTEALEENQLLASRVEELETELEVYKRMLEEANSFVEAFQEIVDDNDDTGIDVKDVSTADESQDENQPKASTSTSE